MQVILVNGPCGAGKTTTTKRLHKRLPQSVLINIDLVRSFISGYREHPSLSWKTGLNLSLALAASAMQQGRTIIVDKMIFDGSAWEPFYVLAKEYGAEVREFILWAEKDEVLNRCDIRGDYKEGIFTRESCERYWQKVTDFSKERPQAQVIDTTQLSKEAAVDALQEMLK
jgi:predicted kinase